MAKVFSSVADDEIANFSKVADDWWNPHGALAPLHRMNPCRLGYIRDQLRQHGAAGDGRKPLKGVRLLDVGCGGGIIAEPLARLGADVTGLDASRAAISAARRHADQGGLNIDYQCGTVEAMARGAVRYDVVTAMEIVEHVADLDVFVRGVSRLMKPGGMLFLSTLNRTPQSFLMGVVAAEYVLRWVPRGTHRWSKFVRPSELVTRLEQGGVETVDLTGVVYHPLTGGFSLDKQRMGMNYMLTAVKR